MDDADMLFEWRNDPDTRAASINTDLIPYENHVTWLKSSLQNDNRVLLISEHNKTPVGTIRLDYAPNEITEISWTIAPSQRGKGFGKALLSSAVQKFNEPLQAQIKEDNIASQNLATYCGFMLEQKTDNLCNYQKG